MYQADLQNSEKAPRHSIGVVSRRTGISQLLLRAWERRYGAVTPARTETGRRLYSDRDLEKLSLLQILSSSGHRIGDIASLSLAELRSLAAELPAAATPAPTRKVAPGGADHLADALAAIAALDGRALEQVLSRALVDLSKPRLRNVLIAPLLARIGEMWRDGTLRVAHEHMASAIVASFLSSLNARQTVLPGSPVLAVATPAGQQHELGALLAASAALEAGWEVLYLGRDLPAEDIAAAVASRQAAAVVLSLVFPLADAAVANELLELRRLVGPDLPIVVGGQGAASYAETLGEISARLVADPQALVHTLAVI